MSTFNQFSAEADEEHERSLHKHSLDANANTIIISSPFPDSNKKEESEKEKKVQDEKFSIRIENESTKYGLPWNYHFEIEKTIKRLKEKKCRRVALQFPEGLLLFSTVIADALERECGVRDGSSQNYEKGRYLEGVVILGDVTYGACCVDDYSAHALGCDFLVHYGHSCLVSIKECLLKNMLYVFVEIDIDVRHFVDTVKKFVSPDEKCAFVGTIQFVSALRAAVDILNKEHFVNNPILVPQNKPLSKGELLGCTSPHLGLGIDVDSVRLEAVWEAQKRQIEENQSKIRSTKSENEKASEKKTDCECQKKEKIDINGKGHIVSDLQNTDCEKKLNQKYNINNNDIYNVKNSNNTMQDYVPDLEDSVPALMTTTSTNRNRSVCYKKNDKNIVSSSTDLDLNSPNQEFLLKHGSRTKNSRKLYTKQNEKTNDIKTAIYLGDGRFHLESFMINNPHIDCYQYNPYEKKLSCEKYDYHEMREIRSKAINYAKKATSFGIIMGTLGRQGNPKLVDRIVSLCQKQGKIVTLFLMSEIFPSKLAAIKDIDCYIQIACPRLSIDWGYAFHVPLLNPFEAEVALGTAYGPGYSMDHYSKSGGGWTVYGDHEL